VGACAGLGREVTQITRIEKFACLICVNFWLQQKVVEPAGSATGSADGAKRRPVAFAARRRTRIELRPMPAISPRDQCIACRLEARLRARRRELLMAANKAPNPIDRHVGSRVRMRRMMLSMSQEKLGDALGLTFQQVQKYEKGTNRIGASRLQQISHILQVPVSFFFEGAPDLHGAEQTTGEALSPAYVSDFLATPEGLSLTKAFMRIKEARLRRRIVDLVQAIAGGDDE
jgi:transcriptional regulator with XRE-family HTH domain